MSLRKAVQEWNLIREDEKKSYESPVKERRDGGNRVFAVEDFHHTTQREDESVPHFIRQLEQILMSRKLDPRCYVS